MTSYFTSNRYPSSVHCKLDVFKEDGKYCDITIRVQERAYKCHRLILAAASDYFDAMFGGQFVENSAKEVSLPNIEAAEFELILNFAYSGLLPDLAACDDVFKLLRTSEFLAVSSLVIHCITCIRESPTCVKSIVETYLFACTANKSSLKKSMTKYIVKNFRMFSKNDELLDVPFEEFSMLLDAYQSPMVDYHSGFLHLRDETVLLDVIIRWTNHSTEERRQYFDRLSATIIFECISREYLTFLSKEYGIVCSDQTLLKNCLVDFFSDVHLNDGSDESTLPATYEAVLSSKKTSKLHLLVRYISRRSAEQMKIFSLDKYVPDQWNTVPLTSVTDLSGSFAKREWTGSNEPNDYLYFYGSCNSEKYSFRAYSNLNFSSNFRALTCPPCESRRFVMCAKRNDGIYWYNSDIHEVDHHSDVTNSSPATVSCDQDIHRGIFRYNCELDRWFAVPEMKVRVCNGSIIADDDLLYLIGGKLTSVDRLVQVYDHRAPAWLQIPSTNYSYENAPSCTLNGKVYVSDAQGVESYDPAAGRWEIVSCESSTRSYIPKMKRPRVLLANQSQMVPFENKLWLFTREAEVFSMHVVDPYEPKSEKKWCVRNAFLEDAINKHRQRNAGIWNRHRCTHCHGFGGYSDAPPKILDVVVSSE